MNEGILPSSETDHESQEARIKWTQKAGHEK